MSSGYTASSNSASKQLGLQSTGPLTEPQHFHLRSSMNDKHSHCKKKIPNKSSVLKRHSGQFQGRTRRKGKKQCSKISVVRMKTKHLFSWYIQARHSVKYSHRAPLLPREICNTSQKSLLSVHKIMRVLLLVNSTLPLLKA